MFDRSKKEHKERLFRDFRDMSKLTEKEQQAAGDKAIKEMNREASKELMENDEPFVLIKVVTNAKGDPVGVKAMVAMVGNGERAAMLIHGLESAQKELIQSVMATKLGINPDVISELKEMLGGL